MASPHHQVNWKGPLALAGSVLALGSLAYWLEYSHQPKQEEVKEEEKQVLGLKKQTLATIALVDGGRRFEFKCTDLAANLCKAGDNSHWDLAFPQTLKADDANVNALVSTVSNLTASGVVDLSPEAPEKRSTLLKDYKLDDGMIANAGARRIEVTLGGGQKRALFLGETHPIGDAIFARSSLRGAEKIQLVPGHIKQQFDKDLTFWRDKKVLSVAAADVKRFTLISGDGKVEGERSDGKWTIKKGHETLPGDLESIDGVLTGATLLTAKAFPAEKLDSLEGKKALSGTRTAVQLQLAYEQKPNPGASPQAPQLKTVDLTLLTRGAKKPVAGKPLDGAMAVLVTTGPHAPVIEVEGSAVIRLNKTLKDLRLTKLLSSMERFATQSIRFEGGVFQGAPLTLTNKEGTWTAATGKPIQSKKVSDLLERLSGNRIKDFLTGPAGARAKESEKSGITVTLLGDKEIVQRKYAFWRQQENFYGRDLVSGRQETLQVDTAVRDALPWNPAFFEATPAAAPSAAASPVSH